MEYLPEFPVILVTEADYQFSSNEAIGSELKFWFDHQELGCCSYKQVKKQHTGEGWAEKVASELQHIPST
ncbi:hypothetical protein H6F32_15025 [Anabaena sp. FACHB-1237]|uniref:hypothetical protein n=1 Tax=Anabaena sp. FACHB-1237 TaxID=2692769 RepID=UPI001681519D|nr:hypothetical protein [Anabaena sp. FACHB-1237]MBD2138855.1 hypothetical protein [Anabaena sp. FACHB-1237]